MHFVTNKKKGEGAEKVLHCIVISQTHDICICLHMQINICLINNPNRHYGSSALLTSLNSFKVRLGYGPRSHHKTAIAPTKYFFCSPPLIFYSQYNQNKNLHSKVLHFWYKIERNVFNLKFFTSAFLSSVSSHSYQGCSQQCKSESCA